MYSRCHEVVVHTHHNAHVAAVQRENKRRVHGEPTHAVCHGQDQRAPPPIRRALAPLRQQGHMGSRDVSQARHHLPGTTAQEELGGELQYEHYFDCTKSQSDETLVKYFSLAGPVCYTPL